MAKYPAIKFNQFGSGTEEDELIVFVAPAKAIAQWAGIPRKGWKVRMLYQRWMTPVRTNQIKEFWQKAADPDREAGEKHILGPTAITVAITGNVPVRDGHISLDRDPIVGLEDDPLENLQRLASTVFPSVVERLGPHQRETALEFEGTPLSELPEVSHDYVFEFALQLAQMKKDARWFSDDNGLEDSDISELIAALDSIARPALVVDGQHRLIGASSIEYDVLLPVVAIPRCSWAEQTYQFVVINEKAQRVESSILTDIFGSSLTRREQTQIRDRLSRANVDVESRIASVIANRTPESPFHNMVLVKLSGTPPAGTSPYITDRTIQRLIDARTSDAWGWRSHDGFYESYVRPTYPDREDWDSWSSGAWRDYWFAFWHTVADHYNRQVQLVSSQDSFLLWDPCNQTNLTKSVALRLFQKLFMEKAIERIEAVRLSLSILLEELGEERGQERIDARIRERAIPSDTEAFKGHVQEWFLDKGVPVRFFAYQWKKSLDDQQGRQDLYEEMKRAWELTQKGKRFRGSQTVFQSYTVDDS